MKRLLLLALIVPLVGCSASPAASPATTASAPITTTTPSAPASTPSAAAGRLVTPQGLGELRVGMTTAEGKRLGLATACGPWQLSEEGSRRYPNVWTYWTDAGLQGLAVVSKTDPGQAPRAGEYATAAGLRVAASWAQVKAAYPEAVDWPSDATHWAGIDEASLPFVPAKGAAPLEGLLVRDGAAALVFLGTGGVLENLAVTTVDGQGLARVIQGC